MLNRSQILAISFAYAAILSAAVFPCAAIALTLEKMVEYYVGNGENTAIAPNQRLIGNSFDQRAEHLSRQIAVNEKAGKLPAGNAATLKFDLSRLSDQYQRHQQSDGGFSYGETKLIVEDFTRLSNRMKSLIRQASTPVSYADISARQAELRNRVETGAFSGALTRAEADSIRYSLRWTAALKADLIKTGGFTKHDHDVVDAALDRVDRRLNRWMNNDIAAEDARRDL